MYEELKKWSKDHKSQIVTGFCFAVVFLLGFGTGKGTSAIKKPTINNNYTTKAATKPVEKPAPELLVEPQQAIGSCLVKGNTTSKVYHVKGGAFYAKLKNPKCFGSEEEAKAAGYRKSSR